MRTIDLVIAGAAVFATSLALTALARRYALSRQLLDAPGERRSHSVPTPRGGGVAIVAAMLPVLGWLAWQDDSQRAMAIASAVGLVLVAGIGWIDDHRPLSPWRRLAVHVVAALVLAAGMAVSGQPLWWCAAVFVLGVGLVNVWNFMDGIDGIATSQAMLVGIAALIVVPERLLLVAIVAACAGFLPYNAPRARIFLGDVGSGGLGFLIACLFAWVPVSAAPAPALLLLLTLSAFMVDAALTLLSRILRGERWWTAHVQHLYQRLVQRGIPHSSVTFGYAVWTFASLCLLVALEVSRMPAIIGALASWYLLTVATWFLIRHRLQPRGVRHHG